MDGYNWPALLGCGVGLVAMAVAFIIGLAIGVFICYQLYLTADRLPAANRKLVPAWTFLLLIPLFNLFWLFYVVLKISEGYQQYFAGQSRSDVGDCGQGVGLGWAVAAIATMLPIVHVLAALAALVLMVVYLVKMSQLRALVAPAFPA